jgi:hypothetical protein
VRLDHLLSKELLWPPLGGSGASRETDVLVGVARGWRRWLSRCLVVLVASRTACPLVGVGVDRGCGGGWWWCEHPVGS